MPRDVVRRKVLLLRYDDPRVTSLPCHPNRNALVNALIDAYARGSDSSSPVLPSVECVTELRPGATEEAARFISEHWGRAQCDEVARQPSSAAARRGVDELVIAKLVLPERTTSAGDGRHADGLLRVFHDREYVDHVRRRDRELSALVPGADRVTKADGEFGFGWDECMRPFGGMHRAAWATAAGSVVAARCLALRSAADGRGAPQRVAIFWEGGRHHAQRDRAAGFCIYNDVVLATLQLLQGGSGVSEGASREENNGDGVRPLCAPDGASLPDCSDFRDRRSVLIVDIDAHHGDGQQYAFARDDRVSLLSIHGFGVGVYPGTGGVAQPATDEMEKGYGGLADRVVNVPVAVGSDDRGVISLFAAALERVVEARRCGAMRPKGGKCLGSEVTSAGTCAARHMANERSRHANRGCQVTVGGNRKRARGGSTSPASDADEAEPAFDFVVIVCGADGLQGDPLGLLNFSIGLLAALTLAVLRLGAPTLIVGAGGYVDCSTARLDALVTLLAARDFSNASAPDDSSSEADETLGTAADVGVGDTIGQDLATAQRYLRSAYVPEGCTAYASFAPSFRLDALPPRMVAVPSRAGVLTQLVAVSGTSTEAQNSEIDDQLGARPASQTTTTASAPSSRPASPMTCLSDDVDDRYRKSMAAIDDALGLGD